MAIDLKRYWWPLIQEKRWNFCDKSSMDKKLNESEKICRVCKKKTIPTAKIPSFSLEKSLRNYQKIVLWATNCQQQKKVWPTSKILSVLCQNWGRFGSKPVTVTIILKKCRFLKDQIFFLFEKESKESTEIR